MRNLLFCILILIALVSCDPCPDCGEPVLFEPTVEMIFINQDSIDHIDATLAAFSFNDSAISSNTFILDTLRSRLEEIEIGLDTAVNPTLEQEKLEIENLIPDFKDDSAFYSNLNIDADSISSELVKIKSSINSGLMMIDELIVVETGESINYTDSMTTWSFPLLFNANTTSYNFSIASESYTIAVGYNTFTEVDQERNVLIRAKDISVIESSDNFLSLESCTINCEDGNATFTFYF